MSISPLAPARFPMLLPVPGLTFAVWASGLRYRDREDTIIFRLPPDSIAAQVTTRSRTVAAPVTLSRRHAAAAQGRIQALLVHAGNAIALLGPAGEEATTHLAHALSRTFAIPVEETRIAATGVIGLPFDAAALAAQLAARLDWQSARWERAARAIMTTDTFPKGAGALAKIDGEPVVVTGIAKGSGMIRPDMATMLAFLFTNARLPQAVLDVLLRRAVDRSFHRITVDGDTSTNDMVLLAATGENARHESVTDPDDPRLADFVRALDEVAVSLAQQIVRDGEGARKFVTIRIIGACDDTAARRVAFTIAESPLVKTAIAGGDPNWGRILAAAGRCGAVTSGPERWRLRIGDELVFAAGAPHPDYDERRAAAHMAGSEIVIALDLGEGAGMAEVWTCDLTRDYVAINADYRS